MAEPVPRGQCHGVVGVVHGVGCALGVRQCRRTGATVDVHALLLGGHLGGCQCSARIGATKQHGHAFGINPFACLGSSNVGLVLVVGADHFHRHAQNLATEVVNGHLNRQGAVLAFDVGIQAGHVGDETDLDLVLRVGSRSHQACGAQHHGEDGKFVFHSCLLK